MSESNYFDSLEEIQSNNDHFNTYDQYYGDFLDLQFESNNPKLSPLSIDQSEPQLPINDNFQCSNRISELDLNVGIEPLPSPLSLMTPSNDSSYNNAKEEKESEKETEKLEEIEKEDTNDDKDNSIDEDNNNDDNSSDSDGSDDDEEDNHKIRVKPNKNIKPKKDESARKIRGFIPYGKMEKCCKCKRDYDKNILFVLSNDEATSVAGKPYICIWCSLRYNGHKMLRDWDVDPVCPFVCYRCNCKRSECRFKKLKKSYCSYCSLKKKRTYMLKRGYY